MFLPLFLVGVAFSSRCEPGWTLFQENCYKHIVINNGEQIIADDAFADCTAHDSFVSPAASQDEWNFVIELASRPGNWSVTVDALTAFPPSASPIPGALLLGASRPLDERSFYWFNSTSTIDSTWFGWCPNQPSFHPADYCISLQFAALCMEDVVCGNSNRVGGPANFLRYICKKQAWIKEMPPACEPGWTRFNGNCYKHIVRDSAHRVNFEEAVADCGEQHSYLAPAASEEEWEFIIQLGSRPGNWSVTVDALIHFPQSSSLIGGGTNYVDYLLLGSSRNPGEGFYWFNSSSTWFGTRCPPDDTNPGDYCMSMQFDPVCYWDIVCDNDYTANGYSPTKFLHYICKKPLCGKEGTEPKSDGTCGCKEDYWDITDLNIPDGAGYKKGEKCIPRLPCQNLTNLSIIFVVESSKSIGASNWENLVAFLKTGSQLLNNTVNVRFVKFSTSVSVNSPWLFKPWTQQEYLTAIPSSFDVGHTNTPAGLDTTRMFFKVLSPGNKAAVLIAHSMPDIVDMDKELAMEMTVEVATQLRRDKIDLVALGYGEELRQDSSSLKKLLANPRTDYFQFDGEASELKEMHMSYLLYKVCKRFK